MQNCWEKMTLEEKIRDAVWVADSLFSRNKTAGSSANLSFLHEGKLYITGSGTCFGRLTEDSFAVMDLEGNHVNGMKPSKEWPMHVLFYKKDRSIQSVLHIHSFYGVLWSCVCGTAGRNVIPEYTPYLKMKLGDVGAVEYKKPGTQELFDALGIVMDERNGYLLCNHGPIVGGTDLMSAFYAMEELEESAHVAWEMWKILNKEEHDL